VRQREAVPHTSGLPILVPEVCPDRMNDKETLVREMGGFVHQLAPWSVFSTFTFRWEASRSSSVRIYDKFMKQALPSVSYFAVVETNPSRDGNHIHALWDSLDAPRKASHRAWLERYGRNRIEPCRGLGDVESYCAKYVCKDELAWWWYHLTRPAYARCPLLLPKIEEPFCLSSRSVFDAGAGPPAVKPSLAMADGVSTG